VTPVRPGGAPRHVLGLSAYYHDSAACLLRDGEIVAAAQEERFTRVKGDAAFPAHAAAYCLAEGGVGVGDLAAVAFYDKPLLKFDRLLETYLAIAPRGFRGFRRAGPVWAKEKLFTDRAIRRALGTLGGGGPYAGDVLYAEHHESHAASAFLASPFDEAAVLTVDGAGEWATASIGAGRGAELELLAELHFPDSLGLLYSAFTQYLGFRVDSGEYKVMGLAPYGAPAYEALLLREVVELRDDGSLRLDQRYFDYLGGLAMTGPRFHALFGGPPRAPEGPLTQRHFDLARSVQAVCERAVLAMAREAHRRTGLDRLCLAGGVALNCVANARVLREGPFRDVWVQPAAGDAGGALGAALLAWHRALGGPRRVPTDARGAPRDAMRGARLGPAFDERAAAAAVAAFGAVAERVDDPDARAARVAGRLAEGAVVGWFEGRMEYGPRSLGGRSILADPRRGDMQSRLNRAVKFRESFRPFAPSVLAERAGDWFALDRASPYMLLTAQVAAGAAGALPAVTHVDGSARVQTVAADDHPAFHALLRAWEARTGCPVLVNTSFNVRGEPVVCAPGDALRCFRDTRMDVLVLGPYLLERSAQPGWAGRDAELAAPSAFALD
jgi:carbamoyltransferase